MIIKPPSQQSEYSLIFSGDPSLNLPADPAAREKALEIARERGDWAPLVAPGETPTVFHLRPIAGALFDWAISECQRRKTLDPETYAFALRLALVKIDNFGDHKIKLERAGHEREFKIASSETLDALYAVEGVGRQVVQELGEIVWGKAIAGLSPKS
jgi:hypothetical protein